MACALLNNFMTMYEEFEERNIRLKRKAAERTAEIRELNDRLYPEVSRTCPAG
jgi:hypothetical protein